MRETHSHSSQSWAVDGACAARSDARPPASNEWLLLGNASGRNGSYLFCHHDYRSYRGITSSLYSSLFQS